MVPTLNLKKLEALNAIKISYDREVRIIPIIGTSQEEET
jgi:hypothetical protein